MRRLMLLTALAAVFMAGCATVEIKPIAETDVRNSEVTGARFYRSWPYLLVTATQVDPNTPAPGAGGAHDAPVAPAPDAPPAGNPPPKTTAPSAPTSSMQIIWLPKMNEPYVIDVKPGWGTVNGNFTLDNGWNLTSVGSQLDSKIPETITAVSGLLTAAVGAGASPAPNATTVPKTLIPPGLYRIDFDKTSGLVSGLTLIKPQ